MSNPNRNSDFTFHAEPVPVQTRRDNIYIGIGETADHREFIAIVNRQTATTDIQLNVAQTEQLITHLSDCISVLNMGGAA